MAEPALTRPKKHKSDCPQRQTGERTPEQRPWARSAHEGILALQRVAGNHATSRVLQARMSGALPQTLPPVVTEVLRSGGGQPLASGVRGEMEARFGYDLSAIRIHTTAQAASSAEAMSAKAYTVGNNVVFGAGRYAPEQSEGKRLLAHELAHVVQQSRGGPPPTLDPLSPLEQTAERSASAAPGSGFVNVSGASGIGVARDKDDEPPKKKRRQTRVRPPDKRIKDPVRLRGKHILETYEEQAHDPSQAAELEEERTRQYSSRSEEARHKTRALEVDKHHAYPKFLGGNRIQTYVKLTKELHGLYHDELYYLLESEFKKRGVLPKEAGRSSWKYYSGIFNRLDPKDRQAILDKVISHAERFDARYRKADPARNFKGYPDKRQRLAAGVRRGIKEARSEQQAQQAKQQATQPKTASAGKASAPKGSKRPTATAKTPVRSAPSRQPTAAAASPKLPPSAKPPAVKVRAPAPAATAPAPQAQAPAKPTVAVKAPKLSVPAKQLARVRLPKGIVGVAKGMGAAGGAFVLELINAEIRAKITENTIQNELEKKLAALQPQMEALLEQEPAAIYVHYTVTVSVYTHYAPTGEDKSSWPIVLVSARLATEPGPVSEKHHGAHLEAHGMIVGWEDTSTITGSTLVVDVEQERQRQARAREQRELGEKLQRAAAEREKRKKTAAPAPVARPQGAPPSLAPAQEAAPAFVPIAGMEMYAARTQAGAFVSRAQSWATDLLRAARAIHSGASKSEPKRTQFLVQEAEWRNAVRYMRNWYADHGPGSAKDSLDRLLGVEGEELKSLRSQFE